MKILTKLLFAFVLLAAATYACSVIAQEIKPVKATASSIEKNDAGLGASKAIDNDLKTRWSSNFSDPQWIYLDLGSPQTFNLVILKWEAAYGKVYEIQSSDDATDWKTVYKETNGDGGEDIIYVGNQTARYIRMYGTKRGNNDWGYSLYEFKVDFRDDGKIPAAPQNLRAIKGDGVVFLNWDANTETDLYGYNIYRAQKQEGPYEKINDKVVTHAKYKDKKIVSGEENYYLVKAVDYPGNESSPSMKVLAAPLKAASKNFFSIPSCAWARYIGDIPTKCASSSPDRGVALGGFGAGSFMYSISGSFGPWAMDIGEYDEKWLPEAAFHIYENVEGKQAAVKTLSTNEGMKKSWNKLKVGEGKYYALQPKGWTTYDCFASDISSEFYSPIIANNYKETSYPVVVWKWKFYNSTDKKIDLSLMFTWPQPPFGNQDRKGYKNSFVEQGDCRAIVLKASDPKNTPETQDTEWCLATLKDQKTEVSYITSWKRDGDGSDIWNDFASGGVLSGKKLDNSDSAAALAVKFSLAPKEEKIIPLILSWDFPVVRFGSGTQWWKKYTRYFGREGNNSFKIVQEALRKHSKWEKEMNSWMLPVVNNNSYPDWLKRAAFNELYYSQFGGIFYEGGLKSGHEAEYAGKHVEDSKHFEMECMAYRFCNTFDVRHYSSIIYARLWPQIEKETLINWADAVLYFDPQHQTPHDAGNPTKDPYFAWDDYGTNRLHWKDLHSKFIQQVWRYYYLYKDKEFLNYVWPACKATYGYMKTTDTDKNYLPNNYKSDNTYDSWGLWGTSLLCGGLWVGALESMEKLAEAQNDPILPEVQLWLKNAKGNLDKELWNDKGKYYKIDSGSKFPNSIMADGLNGQRYCEEYGLDDILPKDRIHSHLQQVYNHNVVPLADFNGDGVGDCGAINGIKEDNTYIGSLQQAEEIWTGSTYFLAASMYHAGLKEEALKTAFGVYYLTYEEESTAYWFNTPEAWHNYGVQPRPEKPEQYQRPRAVWELIFEIKDPYRKR